MHSDFSEIEQLKLNFLDRGIVEDDEGLVAGFWIRGRKGKREIHLLEKPIKRRRPYKVERKTIMIDGKPFHDCPVKVYPQLNSLTHWGKYREK